MFELGNDGPSVIVAGIDGSRSSLRAGAYAVGLARRQGALLVFVYAESYPLGMTVATAVLATTDAEQQIGGNLRREIEQMVERDPDRAPRWEFRTVVGDPYSALVKTAEQLRADAVVIGVSEQAGHRFLGSVAVRLVKAGRWPVTVVP
jgi:nucleotide-binding universal stress UspA family protein